MPREALVRSLQERLAREPDVLVAYLYGSHARGTAGPLSDVDVAVLLRDDGDLFSRRLDLIAVVAEVTGQDAADVILLNEAPVALGYQVVRDGVLLVSNDDRARVRYVARTIDRYLDMAPMRKTYAQGTRHRLAEGRFGRP